MSRAGSSEYESEVVWRGRLVMLIVTWVVLGRLGSVLVIVRLSDRVLRVLATCVRLMRRVGRFGIRLLMRVLSCVFMRILCP